MYVLIGITIFLTLLGLGIIVESLIEHKFTKAFAGNGVVCIIISIMWTICIYVILN